MKKVLILGFIFTLSSCSLFGTREEEAPRDKTIPIERLNEQGVEGVKEALSEYEIQVFEIKPGELTFLRFPFPKELEGNLTCKGKVVPTYYDGTYYKAFLAETYFSDLASYECYWNLADEKIKVAEINVLEKTFPSERLNVAKRKVTPNPKDLKRIRKERAFLKIAYSQTPAYPLFDKAFDLPINSMVTSIYGSKRVFNNKKQTQHLGTDYRARVGTPIKASNTGRVIVARDLFYSGNTVTLDHGMGIFTIYGHLSKVKVQEGEIIPKGTIVGLAGATGRVTGPHLHWGVKVNDLAVEGISLIKESIPFVQESTDEEDELEDMAGESIE